MDDPNDIMNIQAPDAGDNSNGEAQNNETQSSETQIGQNQDADVRLTDIKQLEGAIEAILFAAGHPMEYDRIAATLSLTPGDTKSLSAHLADAINADETRGVMMILYPETCQLCTRETYAPYVRDALGIKRGGNLSASSLEVLAIIAYNQPVTRAFIDTVRGVDSAYAVGALADKELITQLGRLDAPGRPMLYGTTDKFLRVFGLSTLAELPEAESVLAAVAALSEKPDDEAQDDEEPDDDESKIEIEDEDKTEDEDEDKTEDETEEDTDRETNV